MRKMGCSHARATLIAAHPRHGKCRAAAGRAEPHTAHKVTERADRDLGCFRRGLFLAGGRCASSIVASPLSYTSDLWRPGPTQQRPSQTAPNSTNSCSVNNALAVSAFKW